MARLLDAGVSLQTVRRAVEHLKRHTERRLNTLGLVARVTVSSFLRGWCGAQPRRDLRAAGARGRRARVRRAAVITPTGQPKHLCTRMPPSFEALANEAGQVLGSDADEVHDADVRQQPIGGPLVDRGRNVDRWPAGR